MFARSSASIRMRNVEWLARVVVVRLRLAGSARRLGGGGMRCARGSAARADAAELVGKAGRIY
jgi:hypothetical protein